MLSRIRPFSLRRRIQVRLSLSDADETARPFVWEYLFFQIYEMLSQKRSYIWGTRMRFVLFFLGFLLISAAPAGSLLNLPDAPTVVLDVGHGGTDRGARAGPPYCEEKRITLLTARLVKQYLEQLGYHVVMTRSADHFISLPKRVEMAKQAHAHIFVSVHYNSSRSPDAKGIEVFFFDSKENKNRATASRKLADSILNRLIRKTSASSRGVKKGNFYVIRETAMPAVLVEGGFISNPKERALLKSRDYQEKIAQGIADGIDRYFKAGPRK